MGTYAATQVMNAGQEKNVELEILVDKNNGYITINIDGVYLFGLNEFLFKCVQQEVEKNDVEFQSSKNSL